MLVALSCLGFVSVQQICASRTASVLDVGVPRGSGVRQFGIGDSMYDEAMAGLSLFKVPRETYIDLTKL